MCPVLANTSLAGRQLFTCMGGPVWPPILPGGAARKRGAATEEPFQIFNVRSTAFRRKFVVCAIFGVKLHPLTIQTSA